MTQRAALDVRLQAAVAERDEALARRLADQLVHRRGLAALQGLLQGPLLRFQGEEAVAWLRTLVRLTPPGPELEAPLVAEPPAASAEDQAPVSSLAGAPQQADGDLEPEPERIAAIQLPAGLHLSPSGGAASPAPAPASLAALRSWLPGEHELPEAC